MEIVILGGQKHASKIKRHFTSSTSLDWRYQHRYEKTARIQNTFQAIIKQEWIVEEYYLKFITRQNETRIFYVIDGMDKELIKQYSSEFWEDTAIAGYSFE